MIVKTGDAKSASSPAPKAGIALRSFVPAAGGGLALGNNAVTIDLSAGAHERKELQSGDTLFDGTIYAGISPITGTALYVAQFERPLLLTWKRAVKIVGGLENYYGHNGSRQKTEKEVLKALSKGKHDGGWRLPTEAEMEFILQNFEKGAFKTMFDKGAENINRMIHWYWTSQVSKESALSIVYGELSHTITAREYMYKNFLDFRFLPVRTAPKL